MSEHSSKNVDILKKKSLSLFKKEDDIGHGSSAFTKKYRELKTGKLYCVKQYRLDSFEKNHYENELHLLSRFSESKIPSLLSLYGYNDEESIIITKYYPKNLFNCIKNNDPISPSSRYIIILGIAEGMKYFHSIGCIHRDLKPDNILIDEDEHGDLKPVICDFSHSRYYGKDMTKGVGTHKYMAPEAEKDNYTNKVDVFSFAILFYELFAIEPPYSDKIFGTEFYWKVMKENYRPNLAKLPVNQNIKDYIELCWNSDPDKRPTFEEIVEKLKSSEFRFNLGSDDRKTAEYLAEFNDSLTPKDPALAKQLADTGDVERMIEYADMLRTGKHVEKVDKKQALFYYEKAVEKSNKNNVYAMIQSALLLIDSENNNDENRLKASKYLKDAIDLGNYDAFRIFIDNEIGQFSNDEFERIIEKCALNGNPEAMRKYGEILYAKDDKEKAFDFFMKAAEKRNIPSISRTARMLDEGDGIKADQVKARLYFEIGIKLNDSYSMLYFAISMLNNPYSSINTNEIVDKFKEASILKNSIAKLFYAIILRHGYFGENINKELARENINDAKNSMSEEEAKLSFNFANKILNDEINGFHKNDAELFLECASNKGIVDAMISYADFLRDSNRVNEALKWLNRAAKNGSKIAREKYCNLCSIFHKLFYNSEKSRIDFGVDLKRHVLSVLALALSGDNKIKLMIEMKKKNVQNIDDVLVEINDAYNYVYGQDPNDKLIRKVLVHYLNDSDFQ